MMSTYGLGQWDYAHMLCGIEQGLMNLVLKPREMEKLLRKIHEVHMQFWDKGLELVGDNIDIVMHSDDLGIQTGPMMSPEMYRRFVKPLHEEMIRAIKQKAKGDIKFLLHSCGSVRSLIPDFIEVGVDILNPVQVSAANMDTGELKKEFGKDLCFCGGGVDTQEILPRGTPEQVRDEVKRRIDDLAPGGGYIFAAVHNIQPDVPPENLQAMVEAFEEHGKY
jgi:uroporphyrinogen decarboxylase